MIVTFSLMFVSLDLIPIVTAEALSRLVTDRTLSSNIKYQSFFGSKRVVRVLEIEALKMVALINVIRVCVFTLTTMFEVRKDGDPNKEMLFTGATGKFQNDNLALLTRGMNVSFVQRESTRECVQSLIRNESDILMSTVTYDGQNFEDVYPLPHLREVKITIFSAYNMTPPDLKHYADIALSAVDGISYGVMTLSLLLIIIAFGLLNFATCIRNKRKRQKFRLRYAFECFAHFVHQDSIDFGDDKRRFISVLISTAAFFILLAVSCVLSTELVVIDKPELISCYDDIMKNPLMNVAFPDALDMVEMLKEKGPNTHNWNFWEATKNRMLPVSGVGVNPIDVFMKHMDEIFHGQMIGIVPNLNNLLLKKLACIMGPLVKEKYSGSFTPFPFYAVDRYSEGILMTSVMNQHFRKTANGEKFIKNIEKAVEAGIINQAIKTFDPSSYFPPTIDISYYEKCLHSIVVMPDIPNSYSVKVDNLVTTLKMITFGVLVALYIWCFELLLCLCCCCV